MKKLIIIIVILVMGAAASLALMNYDTINEYLGFPTRGLEYTLNEEGTAYSVSKGKMGKVKKVVIPETYQELPVTEIADQAFINCTSIEEITLPESITRIGSESFQGCSGLKDILIPENVVSIGFSAFFGCSSLKSYTAPFSGSSELAYSFIGYVFGATYYFDNQAYVSASLETITITVEKSIQDFAFNNLTSLKSLTIANSKQIGSGIVMGCTSLERVTLPNCIPAIAYLFLGPIPDSLKEINLTETEDTILYSGFFRECKGLEKTNIPESIQVIGDEAFNGCANLSSIMIPRNVTMIGANVFKDCPKLTISCEAVAKPTNWQPSWNPDDRPIIWGAVSEEPIA